METTEIILKMACWQRETFLFKHEIETIIRNFFYFILFFHLKNVLIAFCSVSKDYLFRLWHFHGSEFMAEQWNLQAIHFVFVNKQLQQKCSTPTATMPY